MKRTKRTHVARICCLRAGIREMGMVRSPLPVHGGPGTYCAARDCVLDPQADSQRR